ncbi:MAG: hypothetical protein Q9157_008703 [Trypethelium eluteriae]
MRLGRLSGAEIHAAKALDASYRQQRLQKATQVQILNSRESKASQEGASIPWNLSSQHDPSLQRSVQAKRVVIRVRWAGLVLRKVTAFALGLSFNGVYLGPLSWLCRKVGIVRWIVIAVITLDCGR